MVKKRKANLKTNESYILPSPSEDMKTFITKFRVDMMEHIVASIKFAIENKLSVVEVFQFSDSPYVVTIAEKEFEPNLEHINQYYITNEMYELCPRIDKLRNLLKKKKSNEKEKPETGNGGTNSSDDD